MCVYVCVCACVCVCEPAVFVYPNTAVTCSIIHVCDSMVLRNPARVDPHLGSEVDPHLVTTRGAPYVTYSSQPDAGRAHQRPSYIWGCTCSTSVHQTESNRTHIYNYHRGLVHYDTGVMRTTSIWLGSRMHHSMFVDAEVLSARHLKPQNACQQLVRHVSMAYQMFTDADVQREGERGRACVRTGEGEGRQEMK